jgi:diguanylate cyclase (GGDEF)-like protein
MSENNQELLQRDLLRPIELSSWALVVFGVLVIWWLPATEYAQRIVFVLLLAFAMCMFLYFHWLYPRYKNTRWANLIPLAANILMVSGLDYLLGPAVNFEIIYIVIIIDAAIRLGQRPALVAGLLSGASVFLVGLARSGPAPAGIISSGVTIIVYLIAGYLSGTLTNSTRRQIERMGVLNQVARATGSTIEMNALLKLTYEQLRRVIPTDTYYVGLHELTQDFIDLHIVFDLGNHFPAQRIPFGDGLASLVIQRRHPLLIRCLSKERSSLPISPVVVGLGKSSESWLGVPLLMNHGFTGVLAVASYKPNAFDEGDVELLSSIGGQVALALENARHHAEVEEQARRDSLTGAYNHGYLLERLEEEILCARADGRHVSLIMLDIDYFKNYNDRFGHVMGDQVLRLTVQAIRTHVKQADVVGRWGGEEFGIVLQNATTEQARGVADRIRETLVALPLVDVTGHAIPNPTVSQGIATFPDHVANADQLVDLADTMLYEAKEQGRDQVRVAEPFRSCAPRGRLAGSITA